MVVEVIFWGVLLKCKLLREVSASEFVPQLPFGSLEPGPVWLEGKMMLRVQRAWHCALFSNPSGYESDYTQPVSGCQDNPTCFPKIWPQTWGSAWPVSPKWEQTPPSIWLCPAPRLSLQSPPPLPLFLSSPSILLPFLPSPCLLSLLFCWKTKSRSRFGWNHIRCHTLSAHIPPSLHSHCLVL